ncbi:hypothetical protein C8Q79DRAFT_755391 [Trametes meyenii]|nr:hypothetical protein C8Q79DRAFT_755391 [Trametes meyenii]
MSSSDEYVELVKTIINQTDYTLAAFALLAFEYAITLDREVRLVWGRKVSGATVLFILNRFSCNVVGYMVLVGNGGPPFIWAAFSTLRGYALSGRKWWIGLLILALFIPDIVLTVVYYSKLKPAVLPPPFNCVLSSNTPESTWIHFVIAGRICLIVGDLLVLIITWHSTYAIRRAAHDGQLRMSLTNAILKDGTLYFACLLILNVANIIVNAVPNSSAVSAFQDPITSILVSRFLLNLRDTSGGADVDIGSTRPSFVRSYRDPRRTGAASTLQFADFMNPMGADLDHGLASVSGDSTTWNGDDLCSEGNELSSLATAHTEEKETPRVTAEVVTITEATS